MEICPKNRPNEIEICRCELHKSDDATRCLKNSATFETFTATGNATQAQPTDLKALARLVLERNRQCNSSATQVKRDCNFECNFERKIPQKLHSKLHSKSKQNIIHKMTRCLNGKSCFFLTVTNNRPVCAKNKKPIFDLDFCPDGRWVKYSIEKDL